MKHDDIDRILGQEPTLTPSSGFSASVMDAVRRQVEGPEPLSFPWRRVVPGLAVCLLAIVAIVIAGFSGSTPVGGSRPLITAPLENILLAQSTLWLCGALLGSWMAVRLSLMFSGFER